MDSKRIKKSISRFSGWLGLNLCSLIIKLIPWRYTYFFARIISSLVYIIAVRQRKIALDNLRIAFGKDKSRQEIVSIARDCFLSMAKGGVELIFFMNNPSLIKKRVDLIGKEHLDDALKRGRGVILVSAHFGNFPLLLARLPFEGYRVAGIMRPMRDERVEKMFMRKRNQFKIKTIHSQPRAACVENTIAALRNNEVVFIPIDQNFGTAGVFVDFFGRKAATATGPVVLSQRTQASLIPCFIVRQDDNRHKIIFEEPIVIEKGHDSKETILLNLQKLTNIIESYIRRYPAEWGWIHRRWKSKPN